MEKLKILINSIKGELLKLILDILPIDWVVRGHKNQEERIVVSLTSYGDRLTHTLKYTLISMLRQDLRPDIIVVWLDSDKWNDSNLPIYLKRYEKYGVVVKYCPDNIKSYTKLIPSLREYPNDIIVTVDDDIFYSKNLISCLYNEHLKNKDNICAVQFVVPEFTNCGSLKSYKEWPEYNQPVRESISNTKMIFPQGVGGVLYPPKMFTGEVFNSNVFKERCRFADDVWFFVMGLIAGRDKSFVSPKMVNHYNIDLFRQILKKDRLHDSNANQGGNDVQLQNVLDYYSIDLKNYE